MARYILTIASTGTIIIEADSQQDAIREFEGMDSEPLWEELRFNGIEMTDITKDY